MDKTHITKHEIRPR